MDEILNRGWRTAKGSHGSFRGLLFVLFAKFRNDCTLPVEKEEGRNGKMVAT